MKCAPLLEQKTFSGFGLLLIERHSHSSTALGARDTEPGKQLWEVVKQDGLQGVMTDYWTP